MFFDELDLSDDVLDALDAMNFSECTPIQEQAIPIALTGSDLIAIAQTGSGKTAAYLLPVIDLLADLPAPEKIVNCVVMAPTRELAQQIEQQLTRSATICPCRASQSTAAPTALPSRSSSAPCARASMWWWQPRAA